MKIQGLKRSWGTVKNALQAIRRSKNSNTLNELASKRLEAQRQVEQISESTWTQLSEAIFNNRSESPSIFCDNLRKIREYCSRTGITIPDDIAESLTVLEHKGEIFATRLNRSVSHGIEPQNSYLFGRKFKANNREHFTRVETFVEDLTNIAHENFRKVPYTEATLHQKLCDEYIKLDSISSNMKCGPFEQDLFDSRIGSVADDILHSGQTFYHGTGKGNARAIKRQGFSLLPKQEQAAQSSRELGEGIYLTPDRKVATYYAGLTGSVMHLGVDLKKVAAVNNSQAQNICIQLQVRLNDSGIKFSDPAVCEQIIKNLFTRNGFNAAYSRQALGSTELFAPDTRKIIDAIAGGKQTQLTVFNPKDITIMDKTILQRLQNSKDQIVQFITLPINYAKGMLAAR